jgi:T5SS/PEP-CTERM-associated repeat protein
MLRKSFTKVSPPALDLFTGVIRRLAALMPKHTTRVVLAVVAAGLFAVSAAQAAFTPTGDVEPFNGSSWAVGMAGYVGKTANATLTINGGSAVADSTFYTGYNAGVTGTTNVDGAGTTFQTIAAFYEGIHGTGNLNITNGG